MNSSSRKLSRHPPGAGLSGPARHTEKGTLFSYRRRSPGRREADGEFCHVAGLIRPGLYFSHPEARYFGVGKSRRIRSRLCPAERLDGGGSGALARTYIEL